MSSQTAVSTNIDTWTNVTSSLSAGSFIFQNIGGNSVYYHVAAASPSGSGNANILVPLDDVLVEYDGSEEFWALGDSKIAIRDN